MMTEEKLEKLLENLRVGKYDSDQYTIVPFGTYQLCIIDNQNKVSVKIQLTHTCTQAEFDAQGQWHQSSKLYRIFHKKPEINCNVPSINIWYFNTANPDQYNINSLKTEILNDVSDSLYNSFHSYINERWEQDRLILKSQVDSLFNLE